MLNMEQLGINQLNNEVSHLRKELDNIKHFMVDELKFAKGTEEAWQEIEEGKFKKMSDKEFLEEIDRW